MDANRTLAMNARATLSCALFCSMLCASLTGCAKHTSSKAPAQPPKPARIGSTQKGEASWYGDPYHGRRAASGEVYDMEQLTAAHRTLPFQTWVEVTNLKNGRKVRVRINDRGPFVNGRIIDLSRAAAREIDMVRMGIAPVQLRVIKPPKVSSVDPPVESIVATVEARNGFVMETGDSQDRGQAEAVVGASLLLPLDDAGWLALVDSDPQVWKISVGKDRTIGAANILVMPFKSIKNKELIIQGPK